MTRNYVVVPERVEERARFDEEAFRDMLRLEIDDARQYVEQELGVLRAEATARYRGEGYGDEEEGRTRVVDRTIRDTIMQLLPTLMRVFAGTHRVVEYVPLRAEMEQAARDRTEYANYVFFRDNPGFMILYNWFKDALIRRYGVVKVWWDDAVEVTNEVYTGLTDTQVLALADDPSVAEIVVQREEGPGVEVSEDELPETTPPVPAPPTEAAVAAPPAEAAVAAPASTDVVAPEGALPEGAVANVPSVPASPVLRHPTHTVSLRRERPRNRLRVELVPGEEFLIDRQATGLDDATLVGHQRGVTRSELVAMGYAPEFIDEHESRGDFSFSYSPEALARRPRRVPRSLDGRETTNKDLQETLYTEVWVRVDTDGDGIAELHKCCLLGSEYFLARREPATELPFALLQVDPEPHEFPGTGYADLLDDLQRINTVITRATLDSMLQAVIPRMGVVEDQVNMLDVLNVEPSAVIRMRSPDAVVPITTPFVGQAGLMMLEYYRTKVEERGGIPRTAAGLDADVLQSTTKMAIAAQLSAAQQRIELIARIFAETGIKDLFRLIQKLLMRHQDVPRMVRLRGRWSEVNPATWDVELDVRINVGLGAGPTEERMARLLALAEKQELIMKELGPGNPLVTLDRYRNTLAKLVELGGEDEPESFFGAVPSNYMPPPQPPQPDPALLLAQAQARETEARIAIEQLKAQTAREEMLLKDQQERAKIAANVYLEVAKLEAQHNIRLNEAHIQAAVELARREGVAHVS